MGELPPRTRRIRLADIDFTQAEGTTSAHAENTASRYRLHPGGGNYLRARGEYATTVGAVMKILELPPRTRRIREPDKEQINKLGTTSAHAENTWLQHYSQGLLGNYLRARGEYSSTISSGSST